MVFCNILTVYLKWYLFVVTILILIDGFLQLNDKIDNIDVKISHNPYFNRWFSAIPLTSNKKENGLSHNPYFNRWFSAIGVTLGIVHL